MSVEVFITRAVIVVQVFVVWGLLFPPPYQKNPNDSADFVGDRPNLAGHRSLGGSFPE
jgi:hypothetical protein